MAENERQLIAIAKEVQSLRIAIEKQTEMLNGHLTSIIHALPKKPGL